MFNLGNSTYSSSEMLKLSERLSIGGGASVVGEASTGIMTGQCCTTSGHGHGQREVLIGSV